MGSSALGTVFALGWVAKPSDSGSLLLRGMIVVLPLAPNFPALQFVHGGVNCACPSSTVLIGGTSDGTIKSCWLRINVPTVGTVGIVLTPVNTLFVCEILPKTEELAAVFEFPSEGSVLFPGIR